MHVSNRLLSSLCFLLCTTALLLAEVQQPQGERKGHTPGLVQKNDTEDLYFYAGLHGEIKVPIVMNKNLVSVRYAAEMPAVEAKAGLEVTSGVDAIALRDVTFTERNSAYIPLVEGLNNAGIRVAAKTIGSDPGVLYAEPVFQNSDERLGGTNRLIVKFVDSLLDHEVDSLIASFGAIVVKSLASGPNTFVLELPKGSAYSTLELSNLLIEKFREIVDYAHPDFVVDRKTTYTPNDPLYTNQWHLNSTGQGGALVNADVNAPEAWDITQGSSSVIIAVIDTGTETTHQDLTYVAGWDAVGNDNNPSPGSGENHGTAVAGVAAAKGSNATGVSGACPNCRVMPIRLIVSGMTTADEAEAFNFAWQNGAWIINNSWGPVGSVATLPSSTQAAMNAATTSGRGGKGCVILFAAGNDNTNMNQNGYAAYSGVIAVGASTDQNLRAYYSNYGSLMDICAPSNGGVTSGIWTTDRTGSVGYSTTNYASNFGGTSSACPLVAGVAGLVLTVNPNLTYTQVRTNLTSTATVIDTAGGQWSGGFSIYYGYGKVNALAAVQAAQGGGGGGTTQTFNSTNVPLSIPDNNTTGITSNLPISTTGTVNSVTCNVNITHPYIGDLVVTLIHPNNTTQSVLWNRQGGSADNIVQAFSVSNFNGLALNGTWKLKVQDLAAQDVGTLNSWSLTINYTPGGGGGGTPYTYNWSSTNVPLSIPDNNSTGVTSNLPTSGMQGNITAVSVTMNITHTYKGDLVVTLIHPNNTTTRILHNRTGGSADNIITTFPVPTAPNQSLTTLNGMAPNGTWKLKVQDLAAADVGTLNSWSMQINTLAP